MMVTISIYVPMKLLMVYNLEMMVYLFQVKKILKIMVVDMSSDLLSKRLNWNNIDVAFVCAPKNFVISGLTITIVKKSLLTDNFIRDNEDKNPSLLDWKLINNANSFGIHCLYLICT